MAPVPDVSEADFRRGVELGEVQAFLQPLIDLRKGQIVGYEALARWAHPTRGWLLPSRFLPLIRTGNLDRLLTERVVSDACRAVADWPDHILLSVNVSPMMFYDTLLPEWLERIVEEAGLPFGRLIVELTETAVISSYDRARLVCEGFRQRGARVVLDDFGTGYANLRHVNELPLDALKIDASFVRSIHERQQTRDIVASLVGLGRTLGIGIMAEGIEDPRQAAILGSLGCQVGQGWLFGRAMAPAEAREKLERRRWTMASSRAAALEALVPHAPTPTPRRRPPIVPVVDLANCP